MARASFRESVKSICPTWLLGPNGERIVYLTGLALDALAESTREAVRAWFPAYPGPSARLKHIGEDRGIDRGPNERADDYGERLRTSMVAMRQAGNAGRLIKQLRHYFSPKFAASISCVSDRGVWHTINMTTGSVLKTVVSPSNWKWDGYAAGIAPAGTQRWRRIWIILESTPWSADVWTNANPYDSIGTWGSTATVEEVSAFRRICDTFRCGGVHIVNVIVSFTPGLYAVGNAPGSPMPNGDHDLPATRLARNAAFWMGVPK